MSPVTGISVNGNNEVTKVYHKMSHVEYLDGSLKVKVTDKMKKESDLLAAQRRADVRDAMKFGWDGYRTYAMGKDELLPLSKGGRDNFGGLATTLVDSLDSLWLMDLKTEFYEARDFVRDHVDYSRVASTVSVFETTIRHLGGLLGAYEMSKDKIFLQRADELGIKLIHAYDEGGIPDQQVSLRPASERGVVADSEDVSQPEPQREGAANSKDALVGDDDFIYGNDVGERYSNLAEVGSLQLEFRYLGEKTKNNAYIEKIMKVFDKIIERQPDNGLWYNTIVEGDNSEGPIHNFGKLTIGSEVDSFYETILKIWLQSGRSLNMSKYRLVYDKVIEGVHENLLHESSPSALRYLAEQTSDHITLDEMEQLSCYTGGLIALGAYYDPDGFQSARAQRDLQTAKAITYTCYQMFERSVTGIAGEKATFSVGNDFYYREEDSKYILRPEFFESLYIMHEITGDPMYREWGWETFSNIVKYCKTDIGFASLHGVHNPSPFKEDHADSYFYSETLKYLYLLFGGGEKGMLDKYVFTTRGHLLKIEK